MLINQANERDEALNLAEEQDVTATANGKVAGGATEIQLDVSNYRNQPMVLNMRLKNDATADYVISIQSSDDNFSTTKTEKSFTYAPGAANTTFQVPEPMTFAPTGDEIRIVFTRTAGQLSDVDAWVTPIQLG